MPRHLALALALLAAPVASPSAADAPLEIRPADVERYYSYLPSQANALLQALANGAPADVTLLTEVMRGSPGPLDPLGAWNCRTLKLGGMQSAVALVAYSDFRCEIVPGDVGQYRLVKLTGSQRMEGEIFVVEGDAQYFGVGYVEGGPAMGYADLPPDDQTPVEPGQTHAQVGFFEQMDANRARLILLDPILESEMDILYLTR